MDRRGVAWVSYIPLPGIALLAVRAAPRDRLVRFHARQATAAILFAYLMLFLFGGLAAMMPAAGPVAGAAAGGVIVIALLSVIVGGIGAARGRFTRLRPFWDLLAR